MVVAYINFCMLFSHETGYQKPWSGCFGFVPVDIHNFYLRIMYHKAPTLGRLLLIIFIDDLTFLVIEILLSNIL